MTAMTVFFPLDTVRSRLQLDDNRKSKDTLTMIKELIDEEGVYVLMIIIVSHINCNFHRTETHYTAVCHLY